MGDDLLDQQGGGVACTVKVSLSLLFLWLPGAPSNASPVLSLFPQCTLAHNCRGSHKLLQMLSVQGHLLTYVVYDVPDARLANQCRYAYYLECSLSDLLSVYSDEGHSIVVETSVKELL